jgi:hypothetical protein
MATPKRGPTSATEQTSAAADSTTAADDSRRKPDGSRAPTGSKGAKGAKPPRTAGGKRANPERLAAAQAEAREGLRERTEEGHRAAGRTPPSQTSPMRVSGATRKIDSDLRDVQPPVARRPRS